MLVVHWLAETPHYLGDGFNGFFSWPLDTALRELRREKIELLLSCLWHLQALIGVAWRQKLWGAQKDGLGDQLVGGNSIQER